jgi:sulfoxide reductase heme-binding subunit YedZ
VTRARVIAVGVVALVVLAILERLGIVELPRLTGTEAWTTARAAGVIAFAALTIDVVFGLFASTGLLDRVIPRGASIDVHRWLSGVALALIGVHAASLLADGYIKYDALDALVPGLSSIRTGAVAIGIFAFWGALLVHASFGWRKRIGVRAWRALHFLAFAIFVAGIVHGVTAGSDALRPIYTGAALLVGALVALRITSALARTFGRSLLAARRRAASS